jgi:sulfide:quinone oxidoreductase
MKKTHFKVAIIGGGTAGITVAAQLKKKDKNLNVCIIDPSEKHWYQPAWTLVGAGTFKMDDTERKMSGLIPAGVTWIKESVIKLNPEKSHLELSGDQTLSYDMLIVATGLVIKNEIIEGLSETINKNSVCSNYTDPEYTWKTLQDFKGGTAIFAQASTPIKCGGAPQKIMYLAEEFFVKNKSRDKTNILYPIPGSVIFGVKEFVPELHRIINKKKIDVLYFMQLVKIDGDKKLAWYKSNKSENEELIQKTLNDKYKGWYKDGELFVISFDMMHIAPPQVAPDCISSSPLSFQDGPNKGWMEIDKFTLQHPKYKNVFGIGDVAALPTAKTGAAIRKQAPVLVENIFSFIDGKELKAQYSGYSSCPIVTGYGKMLLAEFKYDNVRDSDKLITKFVDTTKESWLMWILKKYILPFMYWKFMMKGKM